MSPQGALKAEVRPASTTPSSARCRWVDGVESGNYQDNDSAFVIADSLIARGEVNAGMELLERLREHIRKTGEQKSKRYLLADVEWLIRALNGEL